MLGYGRQSIADADLEAVLAVLRGQPLTCGPAVEAFERGLCAATGSPFAVAVANGTAALRLLYQVAGIGPGSVVAVPALTFVATASQALLLGAEVVLAEVEPATLNLDVEALRASSRHLTHVVAVHVGGRLCDLPALAGLCRERGWCLLEDASHALGSTWDDGRRCGDGAYSSGATCSFHPVKNITSAEGGAVLVADPAWDSGLRSLRHHGIVREGFRGPLAEAEGGGAWYHEFHQPATNERLSDLHAALGASQLLRLEAFKARRRAIVERYREALANHPALAAPPPAPGQAPFWHLCPVQVDLERLGLDRHRLFAHAAAAGIALQTHYIPLHCQPLLAGAARCGTLIGAERAYRGLVSLPCFPDLTDDEQDRVLAWAESLARMVL